MEKCSIVPSCLKYQNIKQKFFYWNMTTMTFSHYGGYVGKKHIAGKTAMERLCSPHQITQRYQFSFKSDKLKLRHVGQFKKKMLLRTKFRYYHHVRLIKLPQDINFHWNQTQFKFFDVVAILKKSVTKKYRHLFHTKYNMFQFELSL